MGMPLDLYVIRHGESEANVIISAGEQGDNSLYTQDNVTVPDRSWRLTATGRKQADCIGRWLVAQQPLFDRYLVSPYVRTRETAATMALPKAKWEETRVLRERSWGEINTITKDDFKTNYARNWMFKNTDPLYWRPPAGESIADVAENRVHNLLTSLNRKSDAESVVMVSHGDLMLALMLTLEDLSDEEFMHRAASDEWKITNCTCFHYSRRDPATGRTHKRFRWEQTARPVLDETDGRWVVKVDDWREFKRPVLSNGDLVDVLHAVDRHRYTFCDCDLAPYRSVGRHVSALPLQWRVIARRAFLLRVVKRVRRQSHVQSNRGPVHVEAPRRRQNAEARRGRRT